MSLMPTGPLLWSETRAGQVPNARALATRASVAAMQDQIEPELVR